MEQAIVRDLEQIQEKDEEPRMPRGLSLVLVGLGGACIAFAILAMGGRKTGSVEKRVDPLGDLVASRGKGALPAGGASASAVLGGTQLSAKDVTFPSILSDDARPTTALAAVRSPSAAASAGSAASSPPPPTDKLSVVRFAGGTPAVPHDDSASGISIHPSAPSLPAQNVLEATPIVTRPRDAMTKTASDSAQINTAPAAAVGSGHEGGWQLQVSSFKSQAEADQFVDQLRARGHKAYAVEAHVIGRGTWWRVRVGPFGSKQSAQAYRAQFEAKEHVVPFIVQPEASGERGERNERSGDKSGDKTGAKSDEKH